MTEPEAVLQAIKEAVGKHEPIEGFRYSGVQWYVDEFIIDCDADEFWAVVKRVLEQELQKQS